MTAKEKLKEEFKKASYAGKRIINNCLLPELMRNKGFEERVLLKEKTIKECESKVRTWCMKSKNNSPSANIVFSAALHYYLEDKPKYVQELFQEEEIKFGDIQEEFNTPIIKMITGTIIKTVEKSTIGQQKINKKSTAKEIKKEITKEIEKVKQTNLFDLL